MVNGDIAGDATYDRLKERALAVLLAGVSDEERSNIQQFVSKLDEKTLSAVEAQKVLKAIVSESQTLLPGTRGPGRWNVACDLAVRDPGSFLYRLAYSLHLTGQHEALP